MKLWKARWHTTKNTKASTTKATTKGSYTQPEASKTRIHPVQEHDLRLKRMFRQLISQFLRESPVMHYRLNRFNRLLRFSFSVIDATSPHSNPYLFTPLMVRHESYIWSRSIAHIRDARSAVKNFMTSSGCSMEGALPKRKLYQPYSG